MAWEPTEGQTVAVRATVFRDRSGQLLLQFDRPNRVPFHAHPLEVSEVSAWHSAEELAAIEAVIEGARASLGGGPHEPVLRALVRLAAIRDQAETTE